MNDMFYVGPAFRSENMKKIHTIAIGTLVEVVLDYDEAYGVRAFVVEHTRDCDGEPLYAISIHDLETLKDMKEVNYTIYRYMIKDGYTKECLKVVEKGA